MALKKWSASYWRLRTANKSYTAFGIYIIGDGMLSGKRQDAHLSSAIAILKAPSLSRAMAEVSWVILRLHTHLHAYALSHLNKRADSSISTSLILA